MIKNPEALEGRYIPGSENSAKLEEEHKKFVGHKVFTRFPPEPNGYLHIGHAKSMNMNFSLSFDRLGVDSVNRQTYLRYDDTNPEAESMEYITSIREDVEWLGWKPEPITSSSDYFDKLHDLAIELIKRGKAYVCHQTKDDIEKSREICKAKIADPQNTSLGNPNSPWRDRSIEENLKHFDLMKKGYYESSEAVLRMKMDMTHPNPNMWDHVAYRVRYVPHPHSGNKYCIYPTYDYTHCLVDSLEHIDYSICTLEFEIRRESYFWLLEALDLYRPKVFEMSRLNITYVLLSKRKLLKLVKSGLVRGWDDPRMPTIKGLRRRGYTASVLNSFCNEIGVTRNENLVQYEKLTNCARNELNTAAPRLMACLDPIKIILNISNDLTEETKEKVRIGKSICIPDFPQDPSRGSHEVIFEKEIYIDSSDFKSIDESGFYGLAPNKTVALKYLSCHIRCVKFDDDNNGNPKVIYCDVINDPQTQAKGVLQWVPVSSAVTAEIRMYSHLFTVEEPGDNWEAELNPNSEIVKNGVVDSSIHSDKFSNTTHVQFERIGYFVKDTDTTEKKLVFNLTVPLKDSKPKGSGDSDTNALSGAGKSRKEEQARQLAEKMAKMQIAPAELFRSQTDKYKLFDDDGIPTQDINGEPLSKSARKKLIKEMDKHKKIFEKK